MAHVRLLTTSDCHLCDDARIAVARIAADCGATWDEVDIATDEDLLWAYAEQVPVVLVDGRQHAYWRVDEARLRTALTC